jgi:hypothetical protein
MSVGVEICFAGAGSLYFLDAATSPRHVNLLDSRVVDGYTCGVIFAPGMVVLTRAVPAPVSTSNEGTALTDCSVTTLYLARLRADASLSSDVVTLVPYQTDDAARFASHRRLVRGELQRHNRLDREPTAARDDQLRGVGSQMKA